MYIPKHFQLDNEEQIIQFVAENPLGTLITKQDSFQASHLPFLLEVQDEKVILECHLAKINQQTNFQNGEETLVIFTGAHGYISSSVYEKVNAPTYNYQAIHFSGLLQKMSTIQLLDHLQKLVTKQESKREKKFAIDQMPEEMLKDYLNEIVGIRIEVNKIEAAFKLSQNRSEKDFHSIIEDLKKDPINDALVKQMKKTR